MKKILFIIMSFLLILGFVACNNDVIPPITEKEIPTVVTYANWSPNESNLIRECLNSDRMTISSVRHLPIFKFETKAELNEFKNKYKDDFTMDQGYDEVPSFNNETANYDEDFFKDHTLILTYIAASSGSFRYGVSEVKKENGTLMMIVTGLNNPEVYTDDMSGWFLMAEVTKEYLKDCTKFDAQFVQDTSRSTVTTEDTIMIPNGKNEKALQHKIRIGKFVENTKRGIDDEIRIIQYTIEGDPITKDIRYNSSDGTFEIITDTTQDKFGVQEVTTKKYDQYYQARFEKFSNDDTNRFIFHLVSGTVNVDICIFVCQSDEIKENTLPVGHIEIGTFSYIELWNTISKDNPAVKMDGFVNKEEVEVTDIVESAKADVNIDYNQVQKYYDNETDMWMIRFSSSYRAGGDETVYINSKGVTQLIVYGE